MIQKLLRLGYLLKWFLILWWRIRHRKSETVIIAFGDSWLNLSLLDRLPVLGKMVRNSAEKTIDTIQWLKQFNYDVLNCALPGNSFNSALQDNLHRLAIRSVDAKNYIILLSLGGNDMIDILDHFVTGKGSSAQINRKMLARYMRQRILPLFAQYIAAIMTTVARKAMVVTDPMDNLRICFHSYDYLHPEKVPNSSFTAFLKEIFDSRQIPPDSASKIVRVFVDTLNKEMMRFAQSVPVLRMIDLRNQIHKAYWSEQIHPNSFGYRIIAQKFSREIDCALRDMNDGNKSQGKYI